MNLQLILNLSVTLDLTESLNSFLSPPPPPLCSAEESAPVVESNPAAGIEVMQFNKIQMLFFPLSFG